MLELRLYNNSTENNRVDKTDYLENEYIVQGTLREGCNISTPSFLIEIKDPQEVLQYNYAYIPVFKRYYYITDIVSANTKLWQIALSCDVLMSFKSSIYNLNAMVLRNETQYDPTQQDEIPTKSYYDISVFKPTMTEGVALTYFSPDSERTSTSNNIIVTGMSNGDESSAVNISHPYDTAITPRINSTNGAPCNGTISYLTWYRQMINLSKIIADNDTLATYVISAIVLPYNPLQTAIVLHSQMMFGGKLLQGKDSSGSLIYSYGFPLSTNMGDYIIVADFTYTGQYGDFRDYSPYTSYDIYLPYHQWVKINADDLLGQRLAVIYVVDYQTGSAFVEIINVDKKYVVYSANCQLGISISLNTTNALENENIRNGITQTSALQQQADALNISNAKLDVAKSVVSTITGASESFTKGGYQTQAYEMSPFYSSAPSAVNTMVQTGGAIANGVMSTIQASNAVELANISAQSTLLNEQIQLSKVYDTASCSVTSGNFGLYAPQEVYIKRTTNVLVYDPESYYFKHLQGRVLNQYKKLGDMVGTGYTKCNATRIDDLPRATSTEAKAVEENLANGIIL